MRAVPDGPTAGRDGAGAPLQFRRFQQPRERRGPTRGQPRAALGAVLTEAQPTDPMILRYSSSPNALRVVVRMFPPLAIETASLANSSSFGASMMITMS